MFTIEGKYTTATIMIDHVEPECISQIYEMVNHPAFTNPIAIMPDTHKGKGSVIGFTMKVGDKVIPNVVGVDIGCGMLSANFGKIDIDHISLDSQIRNKIPFGYHVHDSNVHGAYLVKEIDSFCKEIGLPVEYVKYSLGSLGGGNHFIEIGRDQFEDIWVTVHSGSRYLGKRVCEYWQKIAEKKLSKLRFEGIEDKINKIKDTFSTYDWQNEIKKMKSSLCINVGKGLEWIDGDDKDKYIEHMIFSQQYATLNRKIMMDVITSILNKEIKELIETIHNYIDPKDNIIRKGAIRSYVGEKIIIPFNMRDGILICEGKSNPEWNYSAPHGSGRTMSRTQAKKCLDIEQFKNQMTGIYSTCIGKETLDEAPDSYKPSEMIEQSIAPTAKIINRIKPLYNLKG